MLVFGEYSGDPAVCKKERLFRAAVSAFCSLARPTRRDAHQLDDLTLPLIESVSAPSLRYAAAILGDVENAPPRLVRRLCEEAPAICAPLLMRSQALRDVDLIALIGRHGAGHARAIAKRPNLHPTIVELLRSLGFGDAPPVKKGPVGLATLDGDRLGETRTRLRSMMRPLPANSVRAHDQVRLRWNEAPDPYRKLLSTALTGVPVLFATALGELAGTDGETITRLVEATDPLPLIEVLGKLGLSEAEAFLVFACVRRNGPVELSALRAFLDSYRSLSGARQPFRTAVTGV